MTKPRSVLDPAFDALQAHLAGGVKSDPTAIPAALIEAFSARYAPSKPFIAALLDQMNPIDDPSTGKRMLEPKDKERCLIAILAAREPGLELAIHLYVGLVSGLSTKEIAATLQLAGVYTGVDNFGAGLLFFGEVLELLEAARTADPRTLIELLISTYGSSPGRPRP